MSPKHWLMKAEPDSRIEKGKDVKFSVDDFESMHTTPWEGVRNHEAKNLMKDMKVGDRVLFYHSNCKNPGIAGFAEVSKESYPDYTAWDPTHPYYDAKTDPKNPKWVMVDLTFKSRAAHLVPLALLKYIAEKGHSALPAEMAYVGEGGVKAIKGMALVSRGRLSVQRVEPDAWDTISEMAQKGGWEEMLGLMRKSHGAKARKNLKEVVEGDEEENTKNETGAGVDVGMGSTMKRRGPKNARNRAMVRKAKKEEREEEDEEGDGHDGIGAAAAANVEEGKVHLEDGPPRLRGRKREPEPESGELGEAEHGAARRSKRVRK